MSSFLICSAAIYYWDVIISREMRWAGVLAHKPLCEETIWKI